MSDTKAKPKSKRPKRRPYVGRTNAVHITLYSPDGSDVPSSVLTEATEAVTEIAVRNRLLVGLADT